jgi:hypothetical protein
MQALSPHMHLKPHYHTHAFKTSLTIMHASSLTTHAFKTSLPHACIQNFTHHANFTVKNRCPRLVAQLGYELNSTSRSNLTLHPNSRTSLTHSKPSRLLPILHCTLQCLLSNSMLLLEMICNQAHASAFTLHWPVGSPHLSSSDTKIKYTKQTTR